MNEQPCTHEKRGKINVWSPTGTLVFTATASNGGQFTPRIEFCESCGVLLEGVNAARVHRSEGGQ